MKRVLLILALITSTQTADAQEKDRIADLEIGYVFGGYGRNTNLSNAVPGAADILSDGEGLVNGLDFRLFDPSKHDVVLKWEFNSDSSSDDYMSHWLTTMAYAYHFEFARREHGLWFAVTPSVGLTGGRTRVYLDDYNRARRPTWEFRFRRKCLGGRCNPCRTLLYGYGNGLFTLGTYGIRHKNEPRLQRCISDRCKPRHANT